MPNCKFSLEGYSEDVLQIDLNRSRREEEYRKQFLQRYQAGLLFLTGVLRFLSGQFLILTILFGTASLASNLDFARPARA